MKATSAHEAQGEPSGLPQGDEHPLMFAARGVDRFFFDPAEPSSLGLMRIATGVLVLYIHLVYCIGLTDYFGPYAWVNRAYAEYARKVYDIQAPSTTWNEEPMKSNGAIYRGQATWSIFFHVEDPKWLWTIHLAILVVMLLFTLGLWTRVTSVLTWLGSLMYIQRLQNGMLFGMDTMTNLGLLYLMIAPCGAALSLDRWLFVRRERLRLGRQYVPQPPQPLVSARFATRLIQMNFCLIYFAAGTSKLLGASWWNATAPNRFLLNYWFAPFDVPAYVTFIKWLASHRWMWEINGAIGVVGTLFLELGFPFLVWNRRMRWFMVCGSILFHTLIALLMGLVTFSIMMLAMVLVFVPPDVVRQTVESFVEQARQLWFGRSAATTRDASMALSR